MHLGLCKFRGGASSNVSRAMVVFILLKYLRLPQLQTHRVPGKQG